MCEQCEAETNLYCIEDGKGIFGSNRFYLCQATKKGYVMQPGDWGLVVTANDPNFVWTEKPVPCQFWGMTDEELDRVPDEELEKLTQWEEKAILFGKQILQHVIKTQHYSCFKNLETLMGECKAAGWDAKKNTMEFWLFHYLGIYLLKATSDNRHGAVKYGTQSP